MIAQSLVTLAAVYVGTLLALLTWDWLCNRRTRWLINDIADEREDELDEIEESLYEMAEKYRSRETRQRPNRTTVGVEPAAIPGDEAEDDNPDEPDEDSRKKPDERLEEYKW